MKPESIRERASLVALIAGGAIAFIVSAPCTTEALCEAREQTPGATAAYNKIWDVLYARATVDRADTARLEAMQGGNFANVSVHLEHEARANECAAQTVEPFSKDLAQFYRNEAKRVRLFRQFSEEWMDADVPRAEAGRRLQKFLVEWKIEDDEARKLRLRVTDLQIALLAIDCVGAGLPSSCKKEGRLAITSEERARLRDTFRGNPSLREFLKSLEGPGPALDE
jgi:hypothetical protein